MNSIAIANDDEACDGELLGFNIIMAQYALQSIFILIIDLSDCCSEGGQALVGGVMMMIIIIRLFIHISDDYIVLARQSTLYVIDKNLFHSSCLTRKLLGTCQRVNPLPYYKQRPPLIRLPFVGKFNLCRFPLRFRILNVPIYRRTSRSPSPYLF